MIQLIQGDCREVLATLPERSVQTCVTSPPYFGLRRYDVAGAQIGMEPTPAEYVAALVEVFRAVRRVLRDDGTLWVNLGDSYSAYGGSQSAEAKKGNIGLNGAASFDTGSRRPPTGLAEKNLLGIPWLVARALQEPYYTGRIAKEIDRVWLAAMIDAEGTICGFTHDRKDDGRTRTGVHVQITNSSTMLLSKANAIWPASRSEHGKPGDGHLGTVETWRWIAHGASNKALLMRELYPYLVVKQKQALIAYNVFMLITDAKRLMHTPRAQEVRDKRMWAMEALSRLNHGEHVDIPSWCVEPPSLHEPGWILRSDCIWHKPNPMPESVTDRPTRSHEYLFLFAKRARYFYDGDAIAEVGTQHAQGTRGEHNGQKYAAIKDVRSSTLKDAARTTRNRRSVWTVATRPYSGAHFAVFPEQLIEPCILAGSAAQACEVCGAPWERVVERTPNPQMTLTPKNQALIDNGLHGGGARLHGPGWRKEVQPQSITTGFRPTCACDNTGAARSVVLDPFVGSGTTCRVAERFGRNSIGIDLGYQDLQEQRVDGVQIEMEAYL